MCTPHIHTKIPCVHHIFTQKYHVHIHHVTKHMLILLIRFTYFRHNTHTALASVLDQLADVRCCVHTGGCPGATLCEGEKTTYLIMSSLQNNT